MMTDPQPSFGKTDLVLKINSNSSGSNKEIEANCNITDINGNNYTLNCESNDTSELDLQSAYSFVEDDVLLVNFDPLVVNSSNSTSSNTVSNYRRYYSKKNRGLSAGSIVALVIAPIVVLALTIGLIYYLKSRKSKIYNSNESSIITLNKQI